MKSHMTKAEAGAFKERWEAVNHAERVELRAASLEQKAKHLAALMASVESFGWSKALASEEIVVRERWNELRKKRQK